MSGIRSSNTKPEIITRKALHEIGYRFRLSSKVGKIKPDIVLRKHNVAIFVHGCYWHQHEGCMLAYSDRNYSEQWLEKFSQNIARDKRTADALASDGWRIATIWECATRDKEIFLEIISQLDQWIKYGTCNFLMSEYRKH